MPQPFFSPRFSCQLLKKVESTQLTLKEVLLEKSDTLPIIIAEQQLHGKGRSDRIWEGETGNLYFSWGENSFQELYDAQYVPYIVSLAVIDALGVAKGAATIKWPNDILLNGKKCAGILIESCQSNGLRYLIIGVGVNITNYPIKTLFPATCLVEEGFALEQPEMLASRIMEAYERWRLLFHADGFEPVRQHWLANCAHHDKPICIRQDGQILEGPMLGIDDQGSMVLKVDGKKRVIQSGDIFEIGY